MRALERCICNVVAAEVAFVAAGRQHLILSASRRHNQMDMGPKSLLVLMKLGFDLRSYYEEMMDEPFPEHIESLVDQIP